MFGTVIRLLPARGFGFARGEDGVSYFIHAKSVVPRLDFDKLHEGQRVEFTPTTTEQGPRAEEVRIAAAEA